MISINNKTTDVNGEEFLNPFKGRRLTRSPEKSRSSTTILEKAASSPDLIELDKEDTGKSSPRNDTQATHGQQEPVGHKNTPTGASTIAALQRRSSVVEQRATDTITPTKMATVEVPSTSLFQAKMEKLGAHINKLLAYYDGRKNVHSEIKRLGSMIKGAYTEAMLEVEKRDTVKTVTATTTITPFTKVGLLQRSAIRETYSQVASSAPSTATKRVRANASPDMEKTSAKSPAAKKLRGTADMKIPAKETPKMKQPKNKEHKKAAWTTVSQKKGKRVRPIRTRPDAIIISKAGDATYADILRKVKTCDNLKTMGENVKAIRRTAKGELILELIKAAENQTAKYQLAIEEVLKETAKVAAKTHTVTLQCRDLDEVTTAEEICEALHVQCKIRFPDKSAVKSLRRWHNGTQTAFICLPVDDAKAVLNTQRVRIGWVTCRIREVESPKYCYKCWGYGHIAQRCTNETDRTKLCRKCGESGHVAVTCPNKEKCALCKGAHAAGSSKCPLLQKAQKDRRR